MQIAITSQNRRTITEHAGKCRNFWLYDIDAERIAGKRLVELPIEQSFHANHHDIAPPLAGINILITASMGPGLHRRLSERGITPLVTTEADPDAAVARLLSGTPAEITDHFQPT